MADKKISKSNIKPDDIKANIYNSIELIGDIEGVTEQDISDLEKQFAKLFDRNMYTLDKTEMYLDEFRNYAKRNNVQYTSYQERRFLNQESVLRYRSTNYSEEINICTKFICLKLNYESNHKLKEKINLFIKIIDCLKSRNYFHLIGVGIKEKDSIVCGTLYQLYRCFEKSMFGDVAYKLSRKGKKIEEFEVKNCSIFQIDSCTANVNKEVVQGVFEEKKSYMGILEIEVLSDNVELDNVSSVFDNMKVICFDIFLEHITNTMLKDLVYGETKLIKEGFHKNE